MYRFEVATELPFYLPAVAKRPEYALKVGERELIVSLRMLRVYFGPGYPEDRGTIYCLLHRKALPAYMENKSRGGLHLIPIRTFITCQFSECGESAQAVIRTHFCEWRDRLVGAIAKALDALRTASPGTASHLASACLIRRLSPILGYCGFKTLPTVHWRSGPSCLSLDV